jgi:universal stress protein A
MKTPTKPASTAAADLNIRHVLVPVDFSEPSLKMLRRAAAFAAHFGAQLTLLHVLEPPSQLGLEDNPLTLDRDKLSKLARRKLNVLAKPQPGGPAPAVKTLVREGKPYQEICRAAGELKADMIIIATHGYAGIEHALLGSTAERVVRHAPCPVLVCRASACQDAEL